VSAIIYRSKNITTPYPQRRSPGLRDYDYAQSGAYFITICTHQRLHLFGEITLDAGMNLNEIGQLAHDYWCAIPEHFPMVELDAFIVMPNHIHGILVLGGGSADTAVPCPYNQAERDTSQQARGDASQHNTIEQRGRIEPSDKIASKGNPKDVSRPNENQAATFGKPVKGSLSIIIGAYKSIVTRTVRQAIDPHLTIWQGRFHDHIIRSEVSLNRIRHYTLNNPALWHEDRFYLP